MLQQKPQYFDIHSHLNFPDYEGGVDVVIQEMKDAGVWTIVIGTSYKDSEEAVRIASEHDGIYACVGIHPVDDQSETFDEEKFGALAGHPKVVAIGECGLDYFRTDPSDEKEKERQISLFKQQIKFALKHGKPLMIHSRNAYDEVADILEEYKKNEPSLTGNIHFFTGNLEQAKRFVALDFSISFDGPITFARDYDEVIRGIPLEYIHAETDAPYAAPVPYRGKQNKPSNVVEIVKKIAEIRGEDLETVKKAMVDNAFSRFKIVGSA